MGNLFKSFPGVTDGEEAPTGLPPMPHRYWRIRITEMAISQLVYAIWDIEYRSTIGGAKITPSETYPPPIPLAGSGNPVWSNNFSTGNAGFYPTAAFSGTGYVPGDPDASNRRATNYLSDSGDPAIGTWIRYDFGTGVEIKEYTVQAFRHLPFPYNYQDPEGWVLESSNDSSNWATRDTQTGLVWDSPASYDQIDIKTFVVA
jgi:hypothetical protein